MARVNTSEENTPLILRELRKLRENREKHVLTRDPVTHEIYDEVRRRRREEEDGEDIKDDWRDICNNLLQLCTPMVTWCNVFGGLCPPQHAKDELDEILELIKGPNGFLRPDGWLHNDMVAISTAIDQISPTIEVKWPEGEFPPVTVENHNHFSPVNPVTVQPPVNNFNPTINPDIVVEPPVNNFQPTFNPSFEPNLVIQQPTNNFAPEITVQPPVNNFSPTFAPEFTPVNEFSPYFSPTFSPTSYFDPTNNVSVEVREVRADRITYFQTPERKYTFTRGSSFKRQIATEEDRINIKAADFLAEAYGTSWGGLTDTPSAFVKIGENHFWSAVRPKRDGIIIHKPGTNQDWATFFPDDMSQPFPDFPRPVLWNAGRTPIVFSIQYITINL